MQAARFRTPPTGRENNKKGCLLCFFVAMAFVASRQQNLGGYSYNILLNIYILKRWLSGGSTRPRNTWHVMSGRNEQEIHVVVGSNNPVKIQAVKVAFEMMFQSASIKISPVNVPSGVSDQPFGDDETKLGARNRAQSAHATANTCDFAVGLEGGLEMEVMQDGSKNLWCMAWMAILGSQSEKCTSGRAADEPSNRTPIKEEDKAAPKWSFSKTSAFRLPPALAHLVLERGLELGHADDEVFKRVNSKQGSGTVGVLTDGVIDRTEYYVHALKLALIPWKRPSMYF